MNENGHCPAHGERETYAAPFAGYISEPNCTCPMTAPVPATASPRVDDEAGRLNTRERHDLATCWNDADGKHQPARWDEVLWKVERILAARNADLHAEVADLRAKVKRVETLVTTTIEGELNGHRVPLPMIWAHDLRVALGGEHDA